MNPLINKLKQETKGKVDFASLQNIFIWVY